MVPVAKRRRWRAVEPARVRPPCCLHAHPRAPWKREDGPNCAQRTQTRPASGLVRRRSTLGQQAPRHSEVGRLGFTGRERHLLLGFLDRDVFGGTPGRHFLNLVSRVRFLPGIHQERRAGPRESTPSAATGCPDRTRVRAAPQRVRSGFALWSAARRARMWSSLGRSEPVTFADVALGPKQGSGRG